MDSLSGNRRAASCRYPRSDPLFAFGSGRLGHARERRAGIHLDGQGAIACGPDAGIGTGRISEYERKRLAHPSSNPPETTRSARLGSAIRVYAIGDIHGMADLLRKTFDAIDADRSARPIAGAIEIYLGDYVDRGPDSAAVIDLLAARMIERQAICLAGNHERMMRAALKDNKAFDRWLKNGGRETLVSFGIDPGARPNAGKARAAFQAAMPSHVLTFLQLLLPMYRVGDYLFVHAGLRPGVALSDQSIEDLTEIREPFLESDAFHGAIVVHGHSPVREPDVRHNRINIDTGAFATGRLTCLAIDDSSLVLIG
jgi:serine/threonine protein phosphatase 1